MASLYSNADTNHNCTISKRISGLISGYNIAICRPVPSTCTHPVAAHRREHQGVPLLAVPVELNPEQGLPMVLLTQNMYFFWQTLRLGYGSLLVGFMILTFMHAHTRKLSPWRRLLTLRLFTHLKEYLHFLDFHLPFPQLRRPGALAVLVGVSGRSTLVPLSTLTASSCQWGRSVSDYGIVQPTRSTCWWWRQCLGNGVQVLTTGTVQPMGSDGTGAVITKGIPLPIRSKH